MIQEQVKKPLAEELLFGRLAKGGVVRVDVAADAESLVFTYPESGPDEDDTASEERAEQSA